MITVFVGDNGPAREQAAKEYVGSFAGVHGHTAINRFNGDSTNLNELKELTM